MWEAFSLKPEKVKAIKYFRRKSRMAERLYINVINMCPTLWYRVRVI